MVWIYYWLTGKQTVSCTSYSLAVISQLLAKESQIQQDPLLGLKPCCPAHVLVSSRRSAFGLSGLWYVIWKSGSVFLASIEKEK